MLTSCIDSSLCMLYFMILKCVVYLPTKVNNKRQRPSCEGSPVWKLKRETRDFPGGQWLGLGVAIGGWGSGPWSQGAGISLPHGQKTKNIKSEGNYVTNSIKTFLKKQWPTSKKKKKEQLKKKRRESSQALSFRQSTAVWAGDGDEQNRPLRP